jgi:hypothetical protein
MMNPRRQCIDAFRRTFSERGAQRLFHRARHRQDACLDENFALELWRFRCTTIINERLEVALGIASWHIEAAEREMRMPPLGSVARSIIKRSVKRLIRADPN